LFLANVVGQFSSYKIIMLVFAEVHNSLKLKLDAGAKTRLTQFVGRPVV
jgi:hypothetical protein